MDLRVQTLKMQTAANIGYLEYTSIISMEIPGYTGKMVHMKRELREHIYILSIESAHAQ